MLSKNLLNREFKNQTKQNKKVMKDLSLDSGNISRYQPPISKHISRTNSFPIGKLELDPLFTSEFPSAISATNVSNFWRGQE